MLSWLVPGFLWLGLFILPATFFYFLRMRFRKQPVSSVYLWQRFLHSVPHGGRLRRRSVLLLLLQILALLALAAAAAQPSWQSHYFARPGTVFLIDVSGSMGAGDLTMAGQRVSRLKAACEAIKKEIKQLSPGAMGMIFLCSAGVTPLGEPTVNRSDLIKRLDATRVNAAEFQETEVCEALQTWLNGQNRPWQACLVTDGGLSLGGTRLAIVFKNALRTIVIGRNSDNLGITSLRLAGSRAEFSLNNGWPVAREVRVSLWRNQRRIAITSFIASPGISYPSFNGNFDSGVYQVQLEGNHDIQPLDDQYLLAWNPVRRFRILLVGQGDAFLKAALRNSGYVAAESPKPAAGFTGRAWDLIIAKGAELPNNLETNGLVFGSRFAAQSGNKVSGNIIASDMDHPLLRYFDSEGLQAVDSDVLPVNPRTFVLATIQNKPVITVEGRNQWKQVNCGFDLLHSSLGLSGTFPILLQNLLQWIVPQGGNSLADTLVAGEASYRSEAPDWQLMERDGVQLQREGAFVKLTVSKTGVYHWRQGTNTGTLVVNLPASELDLTPQPIHTARSPVHLGTEYSEQRIPLVHWFLMAFIIFLVFEWMIWRGNWNGAKNESVALKEV